MIQKPVTIASRRSPLAVAQAEAVRAMLGKAAELREAAWEESFPIKTFVTIGDRNMAGSLAEVGGKGLFVKEIEMALLTREADIAVHSMKDMPAEMPKGLVQACVPEREDPRDAFVSLTGANIEELPEGARVGTSSIRRASQLLARRPDLKVVPFRGNVATRLSKLERGEALGTFLAEAGLKRLGRNEVKRCPIETDVMLPALGQGALCIQTREDDETSRELCRGFNDDAAEIATTAERAFVGRLDGSCRTPMAGLAELDGDRLRFRAEILHPDGHLRCDTERDASLGGKDHDERLLTAFALGAEAAEDILGRAEPDLLHAIGQ
ncbi:hydroxymethylbilane synthase [Parvularcula maris]|uniref:Porphobilinogen deaminase n=1 Tax=Parvularcula maris TaxID=2965077 RepID=A0A9X2L7T4_9PROT|nr:hydroxymethylbilane synthase [Parvularcula maris]MCQ8184703.1 hydroxymethylbilane synthase [Parvularcula maris]